MLLGLMRYQKLRKRLYLYQPDGAAAFNIADMCGVLFHWWWRQIKTTSGTVVKMIALRPVCNFFTSMQLITWKLVVTSFHNVVFVWLARTPMQQSDRVRSVRHLSVLYEYRVHVVASLSSVLLRP